ncbi:glycosyltransferase, partial [Candidatus Microgenomates bacterium]|nr:glycosyltransferase [Candidatus Microgenomates bacterium]
MERKIVVVAPTYNEEENIGSFITAVMLQNVDILISDSHSVDQTAEIVKSLSKNNRRVHYLDVKERGLGVGLSMGLDYAVNKLGADILITMEADLSCDPKQIPEFVKKMDAFDVVVGSRYVKDGKITNWSWWRKLASYAANLLLRLILKTNRIHEFTNLYRAFSKNIWKEVRPKVVTQKGWLFVPAFIFEVLSSKFKIIEIPIVYHDRYGGR